MLRVVSVAQLVISGILSGNLSSIFLILVTYISFLTTFFHTSLTLLKSAGTGTNSSTSNISTLFFVLLKIVFICLHQILNELNQAF